MQLLPTPPDVRRFYYVAEPAERIDGAAFDWFWNDAARSHGKWENASPIGNAIEEGAILQNNNWQLTADSLPAMQMELTPVGRVVRASGVELPATDFPTAALEIPAHANVSSTVGLLAFDDRVSRAYDQRRCKEHDSPYLCGGSSR